MPFTCSIFATRLRALTNTVLTSLETVCAEGKWYSGRPVFIKFRKPQSVTILNGRLFSETQRTISALRSWNQTEILVDKRCILFTWFQLRYADGVNRLLSLSQYVRTELLLTHRATLSWPRWHGHPANLGCYRQLPPPHRPNRSLNADAGHLWTSHHWCPRTDKHPSHFSLDNVLQHIQKHGPGDLSRTRFEEFSWRKHILVSSSPLRVVLLFTIQSGLDHLLNTIRPLT